MQKIIRFQEVASLSQELHKLKKKIVVVGGCFDLLHLGHVVFLEKAKKAGDCLIVLLESDKKVKLLKGYDRPLHTQQERAKVLAALTVVDYVVLLPFFETEKDYDEIIGLIKPDSIALTRGYDGYEYHKRSAKLSGASIKYVVKMTGNHSTSRILGKK